MHLKVSSAKWRPFCLGLNVLIMWYMQQSGTALLIMPVRRKLKPNTQAADSKGKILRKEKINAYMYCAIFPFMALVLFFIKDIWKIRKISNFRISATWDTSNPYAT